MLRLPRRQRNGPPNLRLAQKIAALLAATTVLWAFAAYVTVSDGWGLYVAQKRDTQVGRPTKTLINVLQTERRVSLTQLGRSERSRDASGPLPEVAAERERTDRFIREWRDTAKSAGGDDIQAHVREVGEELDRLAAVRQRIDAGSIGRDEALQAYNQAIEASLEISRAVAVLDDEEIAADGRALIELTVAREYLSREDALVAGILARGRFDTGDHARLVRAAGIRHNAAETAVRHLPPTDRPRYVELTKSPSYMALQRLESALVDVPPASSRPPVSAAQWQQAAKPTLDRLDGVIDAGGDDLVKRATPGATLVIVRLILAGGLGLLAVVAAIVVSITTARALVRQLELLRGAAWELAEKRLPGVVERLGHGEKVDVSVEAPPLAFGSDVIGEVGRAFNAVQETALRTAVEQAELRRGVRDVLLSLARRTQTLVHRQLTMLDTMERRRDIEVKELEELFRLDHLATRMRRNAENLIVLSGALPARGWQNPVPMVDVIRAAVGEVEDYTRVTVMPFGPVELAGRAVGDVTHLLAELIENAVSFSPPDTVVQVGGHLVASGFAIDIEDRGLGMTDEKLAEINERIANPPDFNLQSSVQLGLFVVSKLAERYNVQVSLKRSAYGGTTAVVVIPRELIAEQPTTSGRAGAVTTRNGLEVRQPAGVGAGGAGPSSGTKAPGATATLSPTSSGPHPSGPALVAVPSPAAEPRSPEPSGASEDGGADTDAPAGRDDAGRHGAARAGGARSPGDAASADGGAPAPTEPEDHSPVPDMSTTPSGLPVRVPQANLAEPLRTGEPVVAEAHEEPEDPGRSPEEIQRIMGAYQRGTRKGRSDAAKADRGGRPSGTDTAEGEEDQ